jgi:hypothetical protein
MQIHNLPLALEEGENDFEVMHGSLGRGPLPDTLLEFGQIHLVSYLIVN